MANKPKINIRAMMEKAIQVMNESVPEPRLDGRPNIKVGAVLVRADGTYVTASRGELRDGNHAEFTLIERKCIGERLDDCILFTTLEPCLHRNAPKRGCAKHIVSARIKTVYVGIEDDHPNVSGQGMAYLRYHGVKIEMFEREFQEQIRSANTDFFNWVSELPSDENHAPVEASKFKQSKVSIAIGDLSIPAIMDYRERLGINALVGSHAFNRILIEQGVYEGEVTEPMPTPFGFLLFGNHLRRRFPQAGLLATIHFPDGSEEVRDFEGPMVWIPREALKWLREKLPNPIDRSIAHRANLTDGWYQLVREGVINALVHRNYDIDGAKCHLIVTPDSIIIKSPGEPISPITLEQLQNFSAPMLSRNAILHYVFAKMGLAEERGLGLKSMKTQSTAIGLPQPQYSWDNPYLVLTLYRSTKGAIQAMGTVAIEKLNADEKATLQLIFTRQTVRSSDVVRDLGFDERKVQRILKKLVDNHLVERLALGRAAQYKVRNPNK